MENEEARIVDDEAADKMAVALGTARQYAEDVCKQWMARVFGVPQGELLGHVAHIKFEAPNRPAFTVRLAVVDETYRYNPAETDVRAEVGKLLLHAHLYLVTMGRDVLNADQFRAVEVGLRFAPPECSSIYLMGASPGTMRIGVVRQGALD